LGLRLDLGAVVSKYIGETEKNLSRIFAQANHSSGILFFDEADALFGKRSEVKDSHDRYANDLSNLLFSFHGVVLLGVDRKENLPHGLLQKSHIVATRDYWPPR
jgi:SpoVK/Ycf46/Vps4 family AAA+-type ATPase